MNRPKNKKVLLDTSALIALLKKEPGYEKVENVLAHSAITSVNLCELVSILAKNQIPENEIDVIISDIVPEIIPFCSDLAEKAGKLSKLTRDYGLSLGDQACIATAEQHNMQVYTADKVWINLKQHISTTINLIR
ncbi:MAG TPA: type II toxin-antitoxin system VapC family toxin [Candidatus Megaira endosymbiont of Nemacystus decipiens]|nr:type II toxin-antitoxin system VapC family toxin [Candidatus Megaera endosymbiont of Nemacystus decipiens]